jgi:hypothetical protein
LTFNPGRGGEFLRFQLLLNASEVFWSIEVKEREQLGIKERNFFSRNFSLFHSVKEVLLLDIKKKF